MVDGLTGFSFAMRFCQSVLFPQMARLNLIIYFDYSLPIIAGLCSFSTAQSLLHGKTTHSLRRDNCAVSPTAGNKIQSTLITLDPNALYFPFCIA